jgi:hypothetical protein
VAPAAAPALPALSHALSYLSEGRIMQPAGTAVGSEATGAELSHMFKCGVHCIYQ